MIERQIANLSIAAEALSRVSSADDMVERIMVLIDNLVTTLEEPNDSKTLDKQFTKQRNTDEDEIPF